MSRKRESTATPPLAHPSPVVSDPGRASTVENTPIGTPVGFGSHSRRLEREKDLFLPWHHKPRELGDIHSPLHPDSPLLESGGLDDYSYPLFIQSPPGGDDYEYTVNGPASPMDLAIANGRISSPARNKTSTLTSALQGAPPSDPHANAGMDFGEVSVNGKSEGFGPRRQDSFSGGTSGPTSMAAGGARPISMGGPKRERPRRESVAGSMVGGMSWGGVSVGSWIRDDIIMTGTSPFAIQTPSYHSSSYLPKLEADFMRDFSCCDLILPTMHHLLQHWDENHGHELGPLLPQPSQSGQGRVLTSHSSNQATVTAGAVAAVQQQPRMGQRPLANRQAQPVQISGTSFPMSSMPQYRDQPLGRNGNFSRTTLESVQDIDVVEDMEMDDEVSVTVQERMMVPANQQQSPLHSMQQPYPQQRDPIRPQVPPLDLTGIQLVNPLHHHQGLRNSQPTTPLAQSGRQLQNNPTVSSVNTPTLTTQPIQQRHMNQDMYSAGPLTPCVHAPADNTYNGMTSDMSTPVIARFPPSYNPHSFGFGDGYDMLDLCIDEPARRLFSQDGNNVNQQQYDQSQSGVSQFEDDHEHTKKQRGQQRMAGTTDSTGVFVGDDQKPFKCPVIGCEKAYKNQNGLKYHKTHGHVNQQLQENPDGTFSILNPETSAPYPGTLGMEKEKPYGCEFCGKRYKNLNGLKYHKSHSPPCDPEKRAATGLGHPPTATAAGPSVSMAAAVVTLGAPFEEHRPCTC